MFLKVFLPFLFLILAVSCMNTERKRKASHPDAPELKKTEEEELQDNIIIEKAYENCKKWVSMELDYTVEHISEFDYLGYMGDNSEDWTFIDTYLTGLIPTDQLDDYLIDLQLFTDLFNKHCRISERAVKIVAEEREAAVKKKDVDGNPVCSLELGVEPDGEVMSE